MRLLLSRTPITPIVRVSLSGPPFLAGAVDPISAPLITPKDPFRRARCAPQSSLYTHSAFVIHTALNSLSLDPRLRQPDQKVRQRDSYLVWSSAATLPLSSASRPIASNFMRCYRHSGFKAHPVWEADSAYYPPSSTRHCVGLRLAQLAELSSHPQLRSSSTIGTEGTGDALFDRTTQTTRR